MNHLDPIQRPKGQANKGKNKYCLTLSTWVAWMQVFITLRVVRFENLACADAMACLLAAWQMGLSMQVVFCFFLHLICHSIKIQKVRCAPSTLESLFASFLYILEMALTRFLLLALAIARLANVKWQHNAHQHPFPGLTRNAFYCNDRCENIFLLLRLL